MMKYPIGIQTFEKIINGGYVYVDKTDLIYKLVTEGTIYFLSRPRRFGKSLLVSTLKNYFLGRKELFKGLAIDKLETEWAEYPVFHIDFNNNDFSEAGALEKKLEKYLIIWEKMYGKFPGDVSFGDRFAYVLNQAHLQSGHRCVVLVDEYDKPLLDVLDQDIKVRVGDRELKLEERNRNLLKAFYSVFKGADEDLKFVLLTGVTKFSQVSVFSDLNQPADISMSRDFEALCGITQQELETYFAKPIHMLAAMYACTDEEIKQRLKRRYDGYHFSLAMTDIYNPFSLLNVFFLKDFKDYWFSTGTPTYLIRLLNHTQEDLNEMTGRYYATKEFIDYKATVEKPLPMIYQSGYLTIKAYDPFFNTFLLDFPNNEVKEGFVSLVAANYLKPEMETDNWIRTVVAALYKGEVERLCDLFTSFLASIPYSMRRKEEERERERFFHYTLYLIFRLISVYTTYTEKEQSQGRADCIVETADYIYIFEFKLDGTADEALCQIEEKGYARPYQGDRRKLYKIGVSFSSQTGTVEEWKTEE